VVSQEHRFPQHDNRYQLYGRFAGAASKADFGMWLLFISRQAFAATGFRLRDWACFGGLSLNAAETLRHFRCLPRPGEGWHGRTGRSTTTCLAWAENCHERASGNEAASGLEDFWAAAHRQKMLANKPIATGLAGTRHFVGFDWNLETPLSAANHPPSYFYLPTWHEPFPQPFAGLCGCIFGLMWETCLWTDQYLWADCRLKTCPLLKNFSNAHASRSR
jgi:hypothetical protein